MQMLTFNMLGSAAIMKNLKLFALQGYAFLSQGKLSIGKLSTASMTLLIYCCEL